MSYLYAQMGQVLQDFPEDSDIPDGNEDWGGHGENHEQTDTEEEDVVGGFDEYLPDPVDLMQHLPMLPPPPPPPQPLPSSQVDAAISSTVHNVKT